MPLGIVYRSDAAAEPRVRVVLEIAARAHNRIYYPAALVLRNKRHPASARFLEFLRSDEARGLFRSAGFTPLSALRAKEPAR